MKKNNTKIFLFFYLNLLVINLVYSSVTNQKIEDEVWASVNSDQQLTASINQVTKIPDTDKKKKDTEFQNVQKAVNTKIPPVLNKYNISKTSSQANQVQADIDGQLHEKIYGRNFKNFATRSVTKTEGIAERAVPLVASAATFHFVGKALSGNEKNEGEVAKGEKATVKKSETREASKDEKPKKDGDLKKNSKAEKASARKDTKAKKPAEKTEKNNTKKKEKKDKNSNVKSNSSSKSAISQDEAAEKNLKSTQAQESTEQSTVQSTANQTHESAQASADEVSSGEAIEERNGKETKKSEKEGEAGEGEEKGFFGEVEEGTEVAAEVMV